MSKLAKLAFLIAACAAAWASSADAGPGSAEAFRYRYVSLDAAVPAGYCCFTDPIIIDSGRVYGTVFQTEPETFAPFVVVYDHGTMSVLNEGWARTANNRGVVGGFEILDPDLGTTQAALFVGGRVKRIPHAHDETTSFVVGLTDSGIAFVDSDGQLGRYLLARGRVTPADFGSELTQGYSINDLGIIAGTAQRPGANRAFRYNPWSRTMTLLEPRSTELQSQAAAINDRGEVLGYSFTISFPPPPRCVCIWRGTTVQPYFVEEALATTGRSNRLRWNESGLIVSSANGGNLTSNLNAHLIVRPGVRLKVADLLVEGTLPVWTDIVGINERGDMVGFGATDTFLYNSGTFLLQRVGHGTH